MLRLPGFVSVATPGSSRDGKQVNLQTADRREAFRLWHELALHTTPVAVVAPKLTVRELVASFLEWAEKHTRSYDYYSNSLTKFARTVPLNLLAADLRPFRVTTWLDKHARWGGQQPPLCHRLCQAGVPLGS